MQPNPHPGKLIVFEGLDGSGQTTQAKLLVQWFHKRLVQAHYTKEPTGGPVGKVLKDVLAKRLVIGSADVVPQDVTMALLFATDRAHHLQTEVLPLLRQSVHIVMDRYVLSSLAYQSVAVGYEWVRSINVHTLRPDLTLFLRVSPAVSMSRIVARDAPRELYEDPTRLEQVARNYTDAVERLRTDGERIAVVDADRSRSLVHGDIVQEVRTTLGEDGAAEPPEPLSEAEIGAYLGSH